MYRPMDRRETANLVAVAVLGAFWGLWQMLQRTGDPDMFWHIADGRYFLSHRTIPTTDVFSWWGSSIHAPWTPQEWLSDVGTWLAYRAGGFSGIIALAAILTGVTAGLLYALLRARGLGWFGASVGTVAALAGISFWTTERPQVLTYALLMATMLLLEKRHYLWALLPVIVAANTHGAMWPIFVLVFAYYTFPEHPLVFLASIACTGINPHPTATWIYPFLGLFSSSGAYINESQPTAIITFAAAALLLLALLVLVRREILPLKTGVYSIVILVLVFSARRQVIWVFALLLPLLAPYAGWGMRRAFDAFDAWFTSSTRRAGLSAQGDGWRRLVGRTATIAEKRGAPIAAAVVALAGVALALACAQQVASRSFDPLAGYPTAMATRMRELHVSHVLNTYEDGGYLIFERLAPMVDGRWDPYTPHAPGETDRLGQYFETVNATRNPRIFLNRWGVRWVMVRRGTPLATLMAADPAFHLAASTATDVLYRYLPAIAR